MLATRMLAASALALAMAGVACGDSSGPGDPAPIRFDPWDAAVNSAFCVQGTSLVGATKSGSITVNDCDSADIDSNDEGYYEVWRIKVGQSQTVTFDASSGFDNYLSVWRVNSVSATNVNVSLMAENDDRSTSDVNALVRVQLEPDVDYVVAVAGYDYSATGSYTLQIR